MVVRVFLATILLLFAAAVPARAHDQLVEAVPAEGAALQSAPTEVRLRYSAEVIPIGAELRVTDSSGTDWVQPDSKMVGDTVVQPLRPGAGTGQYTVRWRVVSSDGHPISGTYDYQVGTAAQTGAAQPAAESTESAAQSTEPAQAGSSSRWPLLAGAAAVVLAAVAWIVRARRFRV